MTFYVYDIPVGIKVRKGMRNVRIRVTREGEVTLSVPYGYPIEKAERFALEKYDWIKQNIEKAKQKPTFVIENGAILPVLGVKKRLIFVPSTRKSVEITSDAIIVRSSEKSFVPTAEKFLSDVLYDYLKQKVAYYEALTALKCSSFSVRKMRSKWGVCNTKTKELKFSLYLVFQPLENIDYVVLHEIAHLYRAAHDKKFYAFIARFMPDYKSRTGF